MGDDSCTRKSSPLGTAHSARNVFGYFCDVRVIANDSRHGTFDQGLPGIFSKANTIEIASSMSKEKSVSLFGSGKLVLDHFFEYFSKMAVVAWQLSNTSSKQINVTPM